ncbi:hypothetical protein BP5796_02353 [Coleophoma crateriformis]|uniref:Uncharacterized protein n=1 Tax=Coleophoma crateriformis TaxID=565419 RepID=A0A3D8SZJ6_9HELO|nr:hypothetical protein BP5796_02353 [Coleophoma crateriformis]
MQSEIRDSAPPPPYSETDIYSENGSSNQQYARQDLSEVQPGNLVAGSEVASWISSFRPCDSTISTPIYTPPGSEHHGDGVDHASVSSAAVYIESRSFEGPAPSPLMVYSIVLDSHTNPDSLAYPDPEHAWLERDVTKNDWNTFLNHLFPTHSTAVNERITNQKLGVDWIGDGLREIRLVEQKTDKLDTHSPTRRLTNLEGTLAEWNDNFFKPRGLQIRVANVPEDHTLSNIPSPREAINEGSRQIGGPSEPQQRRTGFARFNPFPSMEFNSQGLRAGSFVADKEGFHMGNIVADSKGFRIGNALVADHRGFRMGGHHDSDDQIPSDRVGSRCQRASSPHGNFRGGPWHDYWHHQSRMHSRGHWRGRGRGRGFHSHGAHRSRSSSVSSSSSSSTSVSDLSSSSGESIGSLPNYDALKVEQLPVARQSLLDWLNHPEQPITKESMNRMREELRLVRKPPMGAEEDVSALRKEVKVLMKRFNAVKEVQKANQRVVRKLNRASRKAVNRQRRTIKKEEKRTRRAARKGKAVNHSLGASVNHGPPMPFPMPGMRFGPGNSWKHGASPPLGGLPMVSAMHGAWSFTQGGPLPLGEGSATAQSHHLTQSAEQNNLKAQRLVMEARVREEQATQLRIVATANEMDEKSRLKNLDLAVSLEEEAENLIRESDRLRIEGMHLDEELARGLEEVHAGQIYDSVAY